MKETILEVIAFIKNPVLEKDQNTDTNYRFKIFFHLLIISIISGLAFTPIFGLIEELGLVNMEDHAVEELMKNFSKPMILFMGAVIAPVLEELIFRAPLTLFRGKQSFKYGFYVFTILFGFVHRTFNSEDFKFFIKSLQNIYKSHNGLENALAIKDNSDNYQTAIHNFKKIFFEIEHLPRTQKHISDPIKGSAAKRINMFLRWMVRNDKSDVDFGIWKTHNPAHLSCPLDVHSGNVARKLGILNRKQNDWKALSELDTSLRSFDKNDPVKYDFALFGLGVFEKF